MKRMKSIFQHKPSSTIINGGENIFFIITFLMLFYSFDFRFVTKLSTGRNEATKIKGEYIRKSKE